MALNILFCWWKDIPDPYCCRFYLSLSLYLSLSISHSLYFIYPPVIYVVIRMCYDENTRTNVNVCRYDRRYNDLANRLYSHLSNGNTDGLCVQKQKIHFSDWPIFFAVDKLVSLCATELCGTICRKLEKYGSMTLTVMVRRTRFGYKIMVDAKGRCD